MKRMIKPALLLGLSLLLFAAVTVFAGATELKTGIGYVQTDGLRLRAKPTTGAEVLATASYCDAVVIIREVDGWYLVDYNLEIGYMSKDYIIAKDVESLELGFGKFNTDANIRTAPSADASLVDQAPMGETCWILGLNNTWYKVQYEGQVGYVRSDLLELTEKPPYNAESCTVSKGTSSVSAGQQVVNMAMQFLGTPYVWGGTTPAGFDCSGFTRYVYRQLGVGIDRVAAAQLNNGYAVTNLQPGDLLFWANTYAGAGAASHVGIYIGNGQFIHAGGGCVKITNMSDSYYASRYVGARRIF